MGSYKTLVTLLIGLITMPIFGGVWQENHIIVYILDLIITAITLSPNEHTRGIIILHLTSFLSLPLVKLCLNQQIESDLFLITITTSNAMQQQ